MRLAFGCERGVGKDTAVDYLMTRYGGKKLRFASHLYVMMYSLQDYCGFPRQKERTMLIWLGQWSNQHEPEIWTRHLEQEIIASSDSHLFVCDLRWPHEANMLKRHGFTLIRLLRGSETRETGLLDYSWDYTIDNNESINELHEQLDRFVATSGFGKIIQ